VLDVQSIREIDPEDKVLITVELSFEYCLGRSSGHLGEPEHEIIFFVAFRSTVRDILLDLFVEGVFVELFVFGEGESLLAWTDQCAISPPRCLSLSEGSHVPIGLQGLKYEAFLGLGWFL
jgi:hypothetical protein